MQAPARHQCAGGAGRLGIIIGHNADVIKCADWVIDLGPESADMGGYVTFAGRPEDLIKLEDNYTAHCLQPPASDCPRDGQLFGSTQTKKQSPG